MAERRKRGLGRGLGALIPDAASDDRPVDVFFSGGEAEEDRESDEVAKAPRAARTDPAASMQSSRRRKPSGSSTTKSVKETDSSSGSEPAKSGAAAKTGAAAESASGKTSSGSGKTSGAKTRTSNSSATKSAGTKSSGPTTTPAKSTSQKSTQSESTTATSTAAKSSSSKTNSSKSTTSETNSSKATDGTQREAAPARTKAPAKGGVSSTAKSESTPKSEHDPVDYAGGNTSQTSTSGDRGAASADSTEADRPLSEPSSAVASPDSESGGRDSAVGGDVLETHPGVYRSGREKFDEARESAQAPSEETTREVNGESGSTGVSEPSGTGDGSVESSTDADDEQVDDGVGSIPDTEFGEIRVDLVDANPRQPRTFFDEDQLSELVHSIREIGVLQPVVVRQKPSEPERFELIMGERRLRATKDAGLETIPAIIRYVDDTDLLRDALLENLHRAELNPLEEAAAYGQLLEDFGCTQEELSDRIGRSRPQISNTLRLLRLPPLVQRRVAAGVISAGHARAILGLREPEDMEILAQRIVAEGLSVRASEEAVVLLNRGDSMNVPRATPRVDPQFTAVAERLGDRLDTKVNITVGKKKGKLSVEFANQDDLDRILDLLGVEAAAE